MKPTWTKIEFSFQFLSKFNQNPLSSLNNQTYERTDMTSPMRSTAPSNLAPVAAHLACVREVPDPSLNRDTACLPALEVCNGTAVLPREFRDKH